MGGAIVGFGAADFGAEAGWELWLAAGTVVPLCPAVFDVACRCGLRFDADGDGDGLVPLADGRGVEPPPAG